MNKRVLLYCGILASALYILGDITAATIIYPGYRYFDQMVSQLSAVGAPTRELMLTLYSIYNLLVLAFGVGVILSAGRIKVLRITGILLVIYASVEIVMGFFPRMAMQLSGDFAENIPHMIATAITVLSLMLFIAFGAFTQDKRFKIYSFITIVLMLIFGFWTSAQAKSLDENFSAPWMGMVERICVYSPMIWILVFATTLLRLKQKLLSVKKNLK